MDSSVDKIMNKQPKYVKIGYNPSDVIRLFKQHNISRVPVVDENGRVVDLLFMEDFVDMNKMSIDTPVVIMAGGKGTRLDPFTKILPKPLIPLGDKPILQIIMDRFYEQGLYKFILSLGYKAEVIKLWLAEADLPYEVSYVVEDEPLGTAGSLSLIYQNMDIDGPVVVSNCDILLDVDFAKILDFHIDHKADITIVGYLLQNRLPYGVIDVEGPFYKAMKEKPYIDSIINTGVYIIDTKVIKKYISEPEYIDMPDVIEMVKRNDGTIVVYPHHGEFFDIGQWELYKETLRKLNL